MQSSLLHLKVEQQPLLSQRQAASITSELEKKSSADPSCGTCVEWTGGAGRWGAALAGASGLLAPMTVTVRAQLLGLSLAVLAAVVTWGNLSQHRQVKTIKALTETSRLQQLSQSLCGVLGYLFYAARCDSGAQVVARLFVALLLPNLVFMTLKKTTTHTYKYTSLSLQVFTQTQRVEYNRITFTIVNQLQQRRLQGYANSTQSNLFMHHCNCIWWRL